MPNRNLLFVVYIKNELILLYQFLGFFSATYFNHSKYLNVFISVMKNRLMDNKVITFSFLLKSKLAFNIKVFECLIQYRTQKIYLKYERRIWNYNWNNWQPGDTQFSMDFDESLREGLKCFWEKPSEDDMICVCDQEKLIFRNLCCLFATISLNRSLAAI